MSCNISKFDISTVTATKEDSSSDLMGSFYFRALTLLITPGVKKH
jgi:hypothetical protein